MAPVDQESINLHHTAWLAHRQDSIGLSLLLPGPFIPSFAWRMEEVWSWQHFG